MDDALLDKIVDSARKLITEEGFASLSMVKLARTAGLTLAELYRHVPDRAALLQLFVRRVDLAVLAQTSSVDANEPPRERVFDMLMARFEAAAPDRATLRVIRHDLRRYPGDALRLAPALLNSMRWSAEAKGISTDNLSGAARLRALLTLYLSVLPVWLDDDDPGLAKTMAALDRRLRRMENLWPAIWGDKRSTGKSGDGHEAHA